MIKYFEKEQIKKLISRARTENAVTILQKTCKGTEFEKFSIIISSRFADFKRKEILGINKKSELHQLEIDILSFIDNEEYFLYQDEVKKLKNWNFLPIIDDLILALNKIAIANREIFQIILINSDNEISVDSNLLLEKSTLESIKEKVIESSLSIEYLGKFSEWRTIVKNLQSQIYYETIKQELINLEKIIEYLAFIYYNLKWEPNIVFTPFDYESIRINNYSKQYINYGEFSINWASYNVEIRTTMNLKAFSNEIDLNLKKLVNKRTSDINIGVLTSSVLDYIYNLEKIIVEVGRIKGSLMTV